MQDNRRSYGWLDKRIDIGTIIQILVIAIGGIWAVATASQKIDTVVHKVDEVASRLDDSVKRLDQRIDGLMEKR